MAHFSKILIFCLCLLCIITKNVLGILWHHTKNLYQTVLPYTHFRALKHTVKIFFPKNLLFYGILKKNHFEKDIFRMENTEDMHVFQKLHKNWIFSSDFVFFDVIRQITFLKKEQNFSENNSL